MQDKQYSGTAEECITVTEMARRVGLSRARFYELMAQGYFPKPSRNPKTKRPFFSREQQDQCLSIRKTGRGLNGEIVLFYGVLSAKTEQHLPKSKSRKRNVKPLSQGVDPAMESLRKGLFQLGMFSVPSDMLKAALAECFPDGHRDVDSAVLLKTIFAHLNRRNSTNNVNG